MGKTIYQGVTYKNTGWRVKNIKEKPVTCSLIKSPTVFIEPIPRYKIELLMDKYPYQEWLGYLVGRVSEKENYFVEDLSIPPHKEASAASAEAEPFHIPEGCIGVIHSHNGMGAFHSATDQAYVDKNFPISITVAKKAGSIEFDTVSYQVTLCGKGITVKCLVKYVQPKPPFDSTTFMKEAVDNIDKGKTVYQFGSVYQPGEAIYPRYSGRQLPKQLPYSGFTDYVVGENGEVMSLKELEAIEKEIWGD